MSNNGSDSSGSILASEFRRQAVVSTVTALIAIFVAILSVLFNYFKNLPGPLGLVPAGAIVAFYSKPDRSHEDVCPSPGWIPFVEGNGRFIVGAGPQLEPWKRYKDGEEMPSGPLVQFSAKAPLTKGGEENHILSEIEIPKHFHHLNAIFGKRPDLPTGDDKFIIVRNSWTERPTPLDAGERQAITGTFVAGGDGNHNNMPPYIALYLCIKQ